ncbi:MAG: nucleoside recognition protein [Deltaproteobacteria bacterium]
MLNAIWMGLLALSMLFGIWNGRMADISKAAVDGAKAGVEIAIGLVGIMALWLGVMRIGERAGLVTALSRLLHPALQRLFPEIPKDHPALGAMVMNLAANMLGLGNAATPLGLAAMRDLQGLNYVKDRASDAMCMFLALNTSSVQLVPTTAIAVLAAAGSMNPSAIIPTALVATTFSTAAGILAALLFRHFSRKQGKTRG